MEEMGEGILEISQRDTGLAVIGVGGRVCRKASLGQTYFRSHPKEREEAKQE